MNGKRHPLAAHLVAPDWDELVHAMVPEANLGDLLTLRSLNEATSMVGDPLSSVGRHGEMIYRLQPSFNIEREHKPWGMGSDAMELHRSIHFKPLQGGQIWEHLVLLALGQMGRKTLSELGGRESPVTASLEEHGVGLARLVEAEMYGVVNLFAQTTILEEGLSRLEKDLALLETEVDERMHLTAAGIASPGELKGDQQVRLELLQLMLDEKFAQTSGNILDSMRLFQNAV